MKNLCNYITSELFSTLSHDIFILNLLLPFFGARYQKPLSKIINCMYLRALFRRKKLFKICMVVCVYAFCNFVVCIFCFGVVNLIFIIRWKWKCLENALESLNKFTFLNNISYEIAFFYFCVCVCVCVCVLCKCISSM